MKYLMEVAYQVALDLVEENKIDMDDVMEVRYESTMYTDVLKGDYIIEMYINLIEIQKELEEIRDELSFWENLSYFKGD